VDAHGFDPAERDLAMLRAEGFDRAFIALMVAAARTARFRARSNISASPIPVAV
jgi:hypothetical protein